MVVITDYKMKVELGLQTKEIQESGMGREEFPFMYFLVIARFTCFKSLVANMYMFASSGSS